MVLWTRGSWPLALVALLAACAAPVMTVPTMLVAAPGAQITLLRSAELRLPTGFVRTITEGSRWQRVGAVSQGAVYRAVGTVFTIEGRNIHEAYLVLAPDFTLVGFYLPGESSLSLLLSPVALTTKEVP